MNIKYLIIAVYNLIVYTPTFASVIVNLNAVVFADYQENIYMVTHKDLDHIESVENLDQFIIPQNKWHKIINDAEPQIAKSLINKLASYLPKKELWPYIETGLLRKENKLNGLVADTAYNQWKVFASHRELTKIRTNPKYYNNLSVLTNWKGLFAEPTTPMATLEQATKQLIKYSSTVDYYDRKKVTELRTSIALSTDLEQLKNLAFHENIHIALASYYALSKQAPQEVAYEILSSAIYRTGELKYSYSIGGDVIYGGNKLTLGGAAYDLFSDYLTVKQMRAITYQDPLLTSNKGQRRLNLRNKQIYYTLMQRNIYSDKYKQMIDEWNLKRLLNRAGVNKIKNLVTNNYLSEQLLNQPIMTKNTALAVMELSEQGKIQNNYEWVYVAFKAHNKYSKTLVEYFLNDKNPKINVKPVIENLVYQHNWPRDWRDLKYKVGNLAIKYNITKH